MQKKNTPVKVYTNNSESYAKSNTLIDGKSKSTLFGNKLMAIGLFKVGKGEYFESESGGNLVCHIPAAEIRERMGIKGNSLYKNLKETAQKIISCTIGYEDKENHIFSYTNVLTNASYADGVFTLIFNGDLKQYLTDLERNYTLLLLPLMLKWKNAYSFKLYELLLSKAYGNKNNIYNISFGAAELKFMLGCYRADTPEIKKILENSRHPDYELAETKVPPRVGKNGKIIKSEYIDWYDFKRYALNPAIEEINNSEEADIIIESYKEDGKGSGGKIYKITFLVKRKVEDSIIIEDNTKIEDILSDTEKFKIQYNTLQLFEKYHLPIEDITTICESANYNEDKINRAHSLLEINRSEIHNITGWIIQCIKSNYKQTNKETENKQMGFNDFQQRDYNYTEIEKMLLNNQ